MSYIGRLHDDDAALYAEVGEVGLHDDGLCAADLGLVGDNLDLKTIGVSGVRQELLRLCDIAGEGVALFVAEISNCEELLVFDGKALTHFVDDRIVIDGIFYRLPHPAVLEGAPARVHRHILQRLRRCRNERNIVALASQGSRLLDGDLPGDVHIAFFQQEIAVGRFGDIAHQDRLDRRLAAVVVLVHRQGNLSLPSPLLQT